MFSVALIHFSFHFCKPPSAWLWILVIVIGITSYFLITLSLLFIKKSCQKTIVLNTNNITHNNISECQKIGQWVSNFLRIENKTEWNIAKILVCHIVFLLQPTIIVVF